METTSCIFIVLAVLVVICFLTTTTTLKKPRNKRKVRFSPNVENYNYTPSYPKTPISNVKNHAPINVEPVMQPTDWDRSTCKRVVDYQENKIGKGFDPLPPVDLNLDDTIFTTSPEKVCASDDYMLSSAPPHIKKMCSEINPDKVDAVECGFPGLLKSWNLWYPRNVMSNADWKNELN